MKIQELIGRKITAVEPLCHNEEDDEVLLIISIEGLDERIVAEIDSCNFSDLHEVNFLGD